MDYSNHTIYLYSRQCTDSRPKFSTKNLFADQEFSTWLLWPWQHSEASSVNKHSTSRPLQSYQSLVALSVSGFSHITSRVSCGSDSSHKNSPWIVNTVSLGQFSGAEEKKCKNVNANVKKTIILEILSKFCQWLLLPGLPSYLCAWWIRSETEWHRICFHWTSVH